MERTEVTGRVTLYEDGVYRWIYGMDMQKNRLMFFRVLKILGCVGIGIIVLSLLAGSMGGGSAQSAMLLFGFGTSACMLLAWCLAYLIWSWASHGKTYLLYEMTVDAIAVLSTVPGQKRFAPVPAADTVSTDVNALLEKGRTAHIGSRKGRSTVLLSHIISIDTHRSEDAISLRSALGDQLVYVSCDDYDFVLNFLYEHCPRA